MKRSLRIPFVLSLILSAIPLASSAQQQDTLKNLEAFADGVFETIMDRDHIAGATFAVIRPGQPMIKKGYGFARVDEEIPVNPETTLFRIGSISKLFVWFSVMQMVEQGKLDLDRDVNEYLEAFKIPDTYDQPVTLRSLMTHTPGFEDKFYKLFVLDEDDMLPLAQVLKEQMPDRVRPPMQQASYSNHGTGIAQYLVELASGMPFADYVQQHLFDPLGMQNTTIRQPLPNRFVSQMSGGYAYADGEYVEKPFELVPLQSVGGASTTAHDMTLFMEALLNNTCLNGYCLLDSTTWALMLTPAFSHAPGLNPSPLGIMDISRNGYEIYGHGGNTFLFHSMMAIFPEEQTGIFYSFNSEGGAGPSGEVLEKLVDYYFPDERPLQEPFAMSDEALEEFAGSYRINRYSHSELFKILGWMASGKITPENGKLKIVARGETTWGVPVDSLTFRNEKNNQTIVFSRDNKGRIENMYLEQMAFMALVKNRGIWNPTLHLTLLVLLIAVMFYILIIWPWIFFVRRKYVRADRAPVTLPLLSKVIAWVTALCYLIFFVALVMGMPPGQDIVYGVTTGIKIALFFPLLAIPFTLLMVWQSISLLDERKTRFRSRLFYWLSTIIFLAVIWQFSFWNLLGWNF
ncbi:MAG: serine hydrolase domain-containing protein [Bacteroides sp.]|jgi:CubicO group peptidase (beta-lactamase class C family)|nr:serine hydrolase domain-containing protein [Bacteroides sp.]